MIADALTRGGFEVSAVSDGAGARAAVGRGAPFAAALIDIDLATVRHGELAREIRAEASCNVPALIGLAAHAGPASQTKARRAGLSSAVGKFDRTCLIAAIQSAGAGAVTEIAA
jgi:CheY-like chemotaxis protein